MPQMIQDKPRKSTAGLLVLRLAVAGILAWAGYNRFAGEAQPQMQEVPVAAPADPALTHVDTPTPAVRTGEGAVKTEEPSGLSLALPAVLSPDGVKVDLGWDMLVGTGELGMALLLVLGLFTRLATFIGLGTVTGSALAAEGTLPWSPQVLEPLVQAYQSNPTSALLLGAVFLALLVGGSGPCACDRALKRRRERFVQATKGQGAPASA